MSVLTRFLEVLEVPGGPGGPWRSLEVPEGPGGSWGFLEVPGGPGGSRRSWGFMEVLGGPRGVAASSYVAQPTITGIITRDTQPLTWYSNGIATGSVLTSGGVHVFGNRLPLIDAWWYVILLKRLICRHY